MCITFSYRANVKFDLVPRVLIRNRVLISFEKQCNMENKALILSNKKSANCKSNKYTVKICNVMVGNVLLVLSLK